MSIHQELFPKFDEDVIDHATSLEDVVRLLGERGCQDLTSSLDSTTCGEYACARGGFCDVFKGQLHDDKRTMVAIKSLRVYGSSEHSGDSTASEILKHAARELYHWSKLQHPNVLPLMGLAVFRGSISMLSKWMDNGSLASFLKHKPNANRIHLCHEVCAGLRYIHAKQMVHGDLKAANVMVSSDGVAMIADFGNCRLRELTLRFSNSTQRAISLRWAAPELLLERKCRANKETDVYAYGMTALEVLSGNPPFDEFEETQIVYLVTQGKWPSRPDDLDEDLWTILTSCWAWSANERPDIAEVDKRLNALYSEDESNPDQSNAFLARASGLRNNPSVQKDDPDPKELSARGNSHLRHFEISGELKELDQAINLHNKAVEFTPDDPAADKSNRLNDLGNSYRYRYELLARSSDIDSAIRYQRNAVKLSPSDPCCLNSLGNSMLSRFEYCGGREDLDQAIKYHHQAIDATPDGHVSIANLLSDLGGSYLCRFKCAHAWPDLEKSIDYHTRALKQTPFGHIYLPSRLSNLGSAYLCQSEHTENRADINKAIELFHQAEISAEDHASKPFWLGKLGESYMLRFKLFNDRSDVATANFAFKRAAQSLIGHPRARFTSARNWAKSSRVIGVSPDKAYQRAMELLPQFAWIGITVKDRYNLLVEIGDVAMEAAAWAISSPSQDYSRALQWLEEGRSIIWNQMLQLRTPFAILSTANPALATRLEEVGRELERAGSRGFTVTSSTINTLSTEQSTQIHHRLAMEWGDLLKKARNIPGFEDLMRPRNATELMGAATDGPIVVINVHESRCDALIIRPNCQSIAHVPLKDLSPKVALEAHSELHYLAGYPGVRVDGLATGSRVRGFGRLKQASKLEDGLKQVLGVLWRAVVQPVLDFLGYTHKLPVDDLPHITWCTTGVLSFFPLHAAGCYDGVHPNAFDLVVSSYTPTLSALLSSAHSPFNPESGLLAVGQEHTKNLAPLPNTVLELEAICGYTQGLRYLQLDGEKASVKAVLNAMDEYSCVHLACHAAQDKFNPSRSAFYLYDGRLTLNEITKRSFKNKGLAFLPACQTAAGDERLPDEALHIAGGMLMAGYPTVIASMWSICDIDAPEVTQRVYAELLKDGRMDCKRAARALHIAVGGLREKIGLDAFRRWVPFIHIGV